MSDCYVSAADYARYWKGNVTLEPLRESLPIEDRRLGPADRRAPVHDRRWEQSRGRRFRLSDRRKGKA